MIPPLTSGWPATQADKRRRLDRLGIAAPDVTFVALDLAEASLAGARVDQGWEPDAPSLMCARG